MIPTPQNDAQRNLLSRWLILRHKSRWTKGVLARDANGHDVPPWDAAAVCWCLVGAGRGLGYSGRGDAERALEAVTGEGVAWQFNDRGSTTHNQVISAICKAYKEAA